MTQLCWNLWPHSSNTVEDTSLLLTLIVSLVLKMLPHQSDTSPVACWYEVPHTPLPPHQESNLVVLLSRHLPTTSTWLTARRSGNECSITAALSAAIIRDTTTAGVKRTHFGLYNAIATQMCVRIIRERTTTVVTRLFIAKLSSAAKVRALIVKQAAAAIVWIRKLVWLLSVVITEQVPIITWSDPRKATLRFILTVSFYSCGK